MIEKNVGKTIIGKRYNSDKVFYIVNTISMIILLVIFSWPLWFVIIASISDPAAVWGGKVFLFPVGFSLRSYKELTDHADLWRGYMNTIMYTVCGTGINIILTIFASV